METSRVIENMRAESEATDQFAGRAFDDALPNREAALRQYRERAPIYDLELQFAEPIRRRAINRLWLRRGQTVLDVACGTGLSFGILRKQVGPKGLVIGIEQSAEMLDRARDRIDRTGWRNVVLIPSPADH